MTITVMGIGMDDNSNEIGNDDNSNGNRNGR